MSDSQMGKIEFGPVQTGTTSPAFAVPLANQGRTEGLTPTMKACLSGKHENLCRVGAVAFGSGKGQRVCDCGHLFHFENSDDFYAQLKEHGLIGNSRHSICKHCRCLYAP